MRYLFFSLLIVIGIKANGQIVIQGKVVGKDDHLPLPGVSVFIANTTEGVPTDIKGNFQITIKDGDFLTFRYFGYISQTIELNPYEFNIIQLKPDCIVDHFGMNQLYLSPSYEAFNSILGGKLEFSTTSLFRIWIKTEQELLMGSENRRNYRGNYSVLDIVHGCDFELNSNFSHQSFSSPDLSFKSDILSIQPQFNWAHLNVGFGHSYYSNHDYLNRVNGIS